MASTIKGIQLVKDKENAALNDADVKVALKNIREVFDEMFTKERTVKLQNARKILIDILLNNCVKVDEVVDPKIMSEKFFAYDPDAETEYKLTLQEFAMLHTFCLRCNMFGLNDIMFKDNHDMELLDNILKISSKYEETEDGGRKEEV
jgi:hypothetical protein